MICQAKIDTCYALSGVLSYVISHLPLTPPWLQQNLRSVSDVLRTSFIYILLIYYLLNEFTLIVIISPGLLAF